jgi:hypothetical protein
MTEYRFLLVLWTYVAVTLASIVAGFFPTYSDALATAYAGEPEDWLSRNIWADVIVSTLLLCSWLVGLIGLFFFKRWARSLSLAQTFLGLVVLFFIGPNLLSSLESFLLETSILLWGVILTLAYFSPVSTRFDQPNTQAERQRQVNRLGPSVLRAFSTAGAWWPAVVAHLARSLKFITKKNLRAAFPYILIIVTTSLVTSYFVAKYVAKDIRGSFFTAYENSLAFNAVHKIDAWDRLEKLLVKGCNKEALVHVRGRQSLELLSLQRSLENGAKLDKSVEEKHASIIAKANSAINKGAYQFPECK